LEEGEGKGEGDKEKVGRGGEDGERNNSTECSWMNIQVLFLS
jgi:hypothetical protein